MRLLLFIFFLSGTLFAQDRIYLLDGSVRTGTVNEVREEFLEMTSSDGPHAVSKYEILLVEYRNGRVEIYNKPEKDIESGINSENKNGKNEITKNRNYCSVNTLALTNADAALFYEYRITRSHVGIGIMGAWNFNLRSTVQNAFITTLPNGKKNYDNGFFLNYYPGNGDKRSEFHIGLMMKYTEFSFNREIIDSVQLSSGSSQLLYIDRQKGAQLATLITFGYDLNLEHDLFMRFFGGIGAFNLKGVYRKELNAQMNKDLKPGEAPVNYRTMPKIYLGVNIGFKF